MNPTSSPARPAAAAASRAPLERARPSGSRLRRRLPHHLALAAFTALGLFAVQAVLDSTDAHFRMSMATAYVSLALWVATLATGPLELLRGRSSPVSTDLRRDIGIWAGIVGLVHVFFGLKVHMGGNWVVYFFRPGGGLTDLRLDRFGVTNWLGLAAALVLLLLLALSNDLSLRALGKRRWKTLQRASYVGFGLMMLHGVLFQLIEQRQLAWVALLGGLILAALAFQAAGIRSRRAGTDPGIDNRETS